MATRQLVQLGLTRRIGERGSRRLLYKALSDLEGIFAAPNAGRMALRQCSGGRSSPSLVWLGRRESGFCGKLVAHCLEIRGTL